MVLKKSNSILNTGATQRALNRGSAMILGFHKDCIDIPTPGTISIILDGFQYSSGVDVVDFQQVLDDIYEFLEWPGPDISSFHKKDDFSQVQLERKELSYIKYQNKESVSLPEKARNIMKASFTKYLPQSFKIEMFVRQYIPWTNREKIIFTWKSTEKVEKHLNTIEERKYRRKKNLHEHTRGIKRLNLKRVAHDSHQDEEQEEDPKKFNDPKKVTITVRVPHAIDARILWKGHSFWKIGGKAKRKSKYFKEKGFVCGRYSDRKLKGYNLESLKRDEIEALEEEENFYCKEVERCWDFNEYVEKKANSTAEHTTEYPFIDKQKSLSEFIIPSRGSHSEFFSHKKDISKGTLVNSASSEVIVRHPKGSYVFIKSTINNGDSDKDVDSGLEKTIRDTPENSIVLEKTIRDTPENLIVVQKENHDDAVVDVSEVEKCHLDLESKITNFMSKFVPVQMVLPCEMMEQLLNTSAQGDFYKNKQYPIGECHISFGNCHPPTFALKANPEKETLDASWFLTGRATEFSLEDTFAWEVQLGHTRTCNPDGETVNRFIDALKTDGETTLQNLVEIFQKCIGSDLLSRKQVNTVNGSHIPCVHQFRESTWLKLNHRMSGHVKTVSVEEALNTASSDHSLVLKSSHSDIQMERFHLIEGWGDKWTYIVDKDSSRTVCDICLLPYEFCLALISCGHVFCLNCWNAHAFFGLCGSDSISCMDSHCKQELNETFLRSLAPGHMVNKWLQRVQDKRIERSELCKWCPNTHCDKVAVLKENSEKIDQFGSLVLCDCNISWCFGCQTAPHWPASCDQMAAFRKLLIKTGNNIEIPVDQVYHTVQVKPCPRCHYPIEKNEGCNSMLCEMCWFNFCWNCLRTNMDEHSFDECKAQSVNLNTVDLHNQRDHKFPLKFFFEYLEMNRKKIEIESRKVSTWLKVIRRYNTMHLKVPACISLQLRDDGKAKYNAKNIAEYSVEFLCEVYTFLESYYVLISVVNMNKEKPRRDITYIVLECASIAENLRFITWRLEEQVLHKNLSHILKYANTADKLFDSGRKWMTVIKKNLHFLQGLTNCIDPSSIAVCADLEPMQFFGYK